jgi:hypothetical protein
MTEGKVAQYLGVQKSTVLKISWSFLLYELDSINIGATPPVVQEANF